MILVDWTAYETAGAHIVCDLPWLRFGVWCPVRRSYGKVYERKIPG